MKKCDLGKFEIIFHLAGATLRPVDRAKLNFGIYLEGAGGT